MSQNDSTSTKTIHVWPRSDGWEVRREGNKKNQGVHQSRELARKHAESMAGDTGAEIVIHDEEAPE